MHRAPNGGAITATHDGGGVARPRKQERWRCRGFVGAAHAIQHAREQSDRATVLPAAVLLRECCLAVAKSCNNRRRQRLAWWLGGGSGGALIAQRRQLRRRERRRDAATRAVAVEDGEHAAEVRGARIANVAVRIAADVSRAVYVRASCASASQLRARTGLGSVGAWCPWPKRRRKTPRQPP